MTGLVAGIAWRELAGTALGKVKDAGGSALKWLGSLDLVHALLLAACIVLAVDHVALILSHRHTAKFEAQLTAANGVLATARANEAALKKAIADQNAAIASLASKSADQQKAGAQASQVAAGRANEAEATSARLRAGTRSAGLKSAPACEPSDALKDQWK